MSFIRTVIFCVLFSTIPCYLEQNRTYNGVFSKYLLDNLSILKIGKNSIGSGVIHIMMQIEYFTITALYSLTKLCALILFLCRLIIHEKYFFNMIGENMGIRKYILNGLFSLSVFFIIKYLSNHSMDHSSIKQVISVENIL